MWTSEASVAGNWMMKQDGKVEKPEAETGGTYPDLRAKRESLGCSLKDLSQKTRVRVAYLEAIESGRFQSLPEQTYAESFIRTYARELGIDSGPILSRYRKYLRDQAGVQEDQKERIPEKTVREAKAPVSLSRWLRERMTVLHGVREHLNLLAWAAGVVLVTGAVLFFFVFAEEEREYDVVRSPSTMSTVKESQVAVPEKPVEPVREEEKQAPAVAAPAVTVQPDAGSGTTPLKLTITATEITWVRIKEDDNPSYQILLKPGDTLERQADKIFTVDVGNAGGIDVKFQGKPLGPLGKSGEVIHLTLPEGARRSKPEE